MDDNKPIGKDADGKDILADAMMAKKSNMRNLERTVELPFMRMPGR